MVILGLIVTLIALALGALLILGAGSSGVSSQKLDISFFDTFTISMSPLALVIAGMVTMFLFWLGLAMIRSALARKTRLRRERKDQERTERERQVALEREREEEQRAHERQLHEQRLSTEAARERAAVAESQGGLAAGGDHRGHDVRVDDAEAGRHAEHRPVADGAREEGLRDGLRGDDRLAGDEHLRTDERLAGDEHLRLDEHLGDTRTGGSSSLDDTRRIDPRDGR